MKNIRKKTLVGLSGILLFLTSPVAVLARGSIDITVPVSVNLGPQAGKPHMENMTISVDPLKVQASKGAFPPSAAELVSLDDMALTIESQLEDLYEQPFTAEVDYATPQFKNKFSLPDPQSIFVKLTPVPDKPHFDHLEIFTSKKYPLTKYKISATLGAKKETGRGKKLKRQALILPISYFKFTVPWSTISKKSSAELRQNFTQRDRELVQVFPQVQFDAKTKKLLYNFLDILDQLTLFYNSIQFTQSKASERSSLENSIYFAPVASDRYRQSNNLIDNLEQVFKSDGLQTPYPFVAEDKLLSPSGQDILSEQQKSPAALAPQQKAAYGALLQKNPYKLRAMNAPLFDAEFEK
jgi:hypothetical protein